MLLLWKQGNTGHIANFQCRKTQMCMEESSDLISCSVCNNLHCRVIIKTLAVAQQSNWKLFWPFIRSDFLLKQTHSDVQQSIIQQKSRPPNSRLHNAMDIYIRDKKRGNLTGNKLSLGNVCKLYWWPQPLSHKHRTATYLRLGKISGCLMDCIDFYCVRHVVASSNWLLRGWEGNTCYFWVTTSNCKKMHRLPGGSLSQNSCGPIRTDCNYSQEDWQHIAIIVLQWRQLICVSLQ